MSSKNIKNKKVDYNEKVLEVKNLKKHFYVGSGSSKLVVPAVNDVSFDVHKREVFGLVGESGCGKTTTGRTLIKLYNPTEGTVDLEGVRIVSGHMQHVNKIKAIKDQLKIDILELDDYKKDVRDIKANSEIKIKKLQDKIILLETEHNNEINLIKEPITSYQEKIYELKSNLRLDQESIKYAFVLEKDRVKSMLKNQAEEEYKYELDIENNKVENQINGMKESAALSKEVIAQQIEEIKANYEKIIEDLDSKYIPLIEESKKDIISKEEAKRIIVHTKSERDTQLQLLNEEYNVNVNSLLIPDKTAINNEIKVVKLRQNQEISSLKEEIKNIKQETKNKIKNLQKTNLTQEEKDELKLKKIEIVQKAKAEIAKEKESIANSKAINNSQDALEQSRKMQMIFQDPISSLNPRMTVKEIVGEGLVIEGGYSDEEITEKVSEVLELVGLSPEFASRYPHEFSGGQRQRIGIARAIIMNPTFIIADEPISALDVSIQAQVINLLSELKESLDLTILFVAHDLSVVRFFCDRIAVMYAGTIVELADSEELFNNPIHPYTKSLLSAIPQPDPDYEKGRKRTSYNPMIHDYRFDKPSLNEIIPGHFVFGNNNEIEEYKKNLHVKNEEVGD